MNQPKIKPSSDKAWRDYFEIKCTGLRKEIFVLESRLALAMEALRHYSSQEFQERTNFLDASRPIYRWSLHKGSGWVFYETPTNRKPWEVADDALAKFDSANAEGNETN